MTKDKRFNMKLDDSLLNRLQNISEVVGCSRAEIIGRLVPSEAVVDALMEDCMRYNRDVKAIPENLQDEIVLRLRENMTIPDMGYNLDYQIQVVGKLGGRDAIAKLYTGWTRALHNVAGYVFGLVGDPDGKTVLKAWVVKTPDDSPEYMQLIINGMIVKMRHTQRLIDSLKDAAK